MIFYFSGVASAVERRMLDRAGVTHLLADPYDWRNIEDHPGNKALDSGAYRAYANKRELNVPAYVDFVLEQESTLDFAVAPDVVRDAGATFVNWHLVQDVIPVMPVWPWEGPIWMLKKFLDHAPLIGIGGLVNRMREQDEVMLVRLTALCKLYPNRFHLFGMNWLKAMEDLEPYAASCDTSKWLDGARRGTIIFVHTKTGRLQAAPKAALNMPNISRESLCEMNARNMAKRFDCWRDPDDRTVPIDFSAGSEPHAAA